MGNTCSSSSKTKNQSNSQKKTSAQNPNEMNQIEIDEIPKDLITRTLKKVDSEIPEESNNQEEKPSGNVNRKRKENRARKIMMNSEEMTIYENFERTSRKLSETDIYLIIKYLKTHFLFYDLSETDLENIVSKMFYCQVKANEFLFKQGDNASCYFIVSEGEVQIIINDEIKKTLKKGEGFGELALLYNAPRSASVKVKVHCGFWAIDRVTFKKSFEEMVRKQVSENLSYMDNVTFFQNLTDQQKNAIANIISSQKFKKGDVIVAEGDPASSFYVIKEGTVVVLKGDKELRKMGKGESFGEQALYYKTVRFCTVKAESEVKCFALSREEAVRILGNQVQTITFKNVMRWAFEKSSKLKKLSNLQIEKILETMTITSMKKKEVICKKGEKMQRILIPIDCNIIQKNKEIVVSKGNTFGEEYLSERNKDQIITSDIYIDNDGMIASIIFENLFSLIGGSWEAAIKKSEKSYEKTIIAKNNEGVKRIPNNFNTNDMKMEDMISIKKLGFGQFGSVYLVKNKEDDKYYAMKCINKAQILEQGLEKHLTQEKNVLSMVDFPFIMKFYRSFKDSNNIYFLEEYVKGMELFDVIRDIGLLDGYESQFYTGSLILAIEYIHSLSVIYRDIKPENIMIDEQGFVKLIDMGTAKVMKQQDRTFTIIGTPHYMAPEIIMGKGYSYTVDIWSIGVCLYEFLCGGVPFGEDADDPYEIYEDVIKKPCNYPFGMRDKKARKIIDQLLSKIPEIRLGGSYACLKSHMWFSNFDWDKLFLKEIKVPYIPPKNKILSQNELKLLENQAKPFLDAIKADAKTSKKPPIAKNPQWDADY